ncbi:MAG: rhodanese-like domain-containing protein [Terriglobales bacterium]
MATLAIAAGIASAQASVPGMQRISAADLAAVLRGSGPKPLVLQVGPQMLYRTAHIAGSEYAGMAAEPAGLQKLRERVRGLKRNTHIVIYCGCCPWEHCPNIQPAYDELRKMGFTNVKALYLPNNFKTDWHDRGYPTETGQ